MNINWGWGCVATINAGLAVWHAFGGDRIWASIGASAFVITMLLTIGKDE